MRSLLALDPAAGKDGPRRIVTGRFYVLRMGVSGIRTDLSG